MNWKRRKKKWSVCVALVPRFFPSQHFCMLACGCIRTRHLYSMYVSMCASVCDCEFSALDSLSPFQRERVINEAALYW